MCDQRSVYGRVVRILLCMLNTCSSGTENDAGLEQVKTHVSGFNTNQLTDQRFKCYQNAHLQEFTQVTTLCSFNFYIMSNLFDSLHYLRSININELKRNTSSIVQCLLVILVKKKFKLQWVLKSCSNTTDKLCI